jgi:hypothetical protein
LRSRYIPLIRRIPFLFDLHRSCIKLPPASMVDLRKTQQSSIRNITHSDEL